MGGAIGARLITLMGIVFSWVLFRAEDFETARIIWGSMLFENGVSLPSRWEHAMPSLAFLGDFLIFDGPFHNGMISYHARTVSFIVLAAIVTLVAPNVYQMTQRFRPVVQSELPVPATARNLMGLSWQPSVIWGVITGLLFGLSVVSISTAREFLYFQF